MQIVMVGETVYQKKVIFFVVFFLPDVLNKCLQLAVIVFVRLVLATMRCRVFICSCSPAKDLEEQES